MMHGVRYIAFLLLLFIQIGCSVTSRQPVLAENNPLSDIYCDSYFIYQMCARDINNSGEVDVVYFQDTSEVFMVNPSVDGADIASMPMHECVKTMDDEMVSASSALLTINENTGMLSRTKMKSRLMLTYTRIMSDISQCHQATAGLAVPSGDDFGNEDYEELTF